MKKAAKKKPAKPAGGPKSKGIKPEDASDEEGSTASSLESFLEDENAPDIVPGQSPRRPRPVVLDEEDKPEPEQPAELRIVLFKANTAPLVRSDDNKKKRKRIEQEEDEQDLEVSSRNPSLMEQNSNSL